MSNVLDFVQIAHRAYVECALWSSTYVDEDGDDVPMDRRYGFDDLDDDSLLATLHDVADFVISNLRVIAKMATFRQCRLVECAGAVGHDLWLTRNGHGTGFWDRGMGDIGDRLACAARGMGESYLYVGDDGEVHVS